MKKCTQVLFILPFLFCSFALLAQDESTDVDFMQEEVNDDPYAIITPKDMWELTPSVGIAFAGADIPANVGFGAGLSIRKSTDYLFSLRFDFLWASISGETDDDFETLNGFSRSYETNYLAGTAFGVFSLNSIRFDRRVKKTNLYAMLGVGGNYYEVTDFDNESNVNPESLEAELDPHMALGAGASFRLSRRINLSIEHQVHVIFGNRADLLDGLNQVRGGFSPFRDVLNYANLRLGINLGNFNKRSEPKYWINPMEVVLDEVDQLQEALAAQSISDSDGDGVIDQFDEEPGSDPNALVDTRGRTLDSDNDGTPDHLDDEPYITPDLNLRIDNLENRMRESQLTEERVRELIEENMQDPEVYLPMVHFNLNSATIRYADYGTLSGVAQLMRQAPNQRIEVLGYTDQTGEAEYNRELSYRRAKAVVDHMVEKHGIARDRFVLRYNGQDDQLVPENQTYMNRRVEFRLAGADDQSMAPPEGYNE